LPFPSPGMRRVQVTVPRKRLTGLGKIQVLYYFCVVMAVSSIGTGSNGLQIE
jgi:hypothetical protein